MKKPQTLEEAIAIIKIINSRGFWEVRNQEIINPVPNMTFRSPGSPLTSMCVLDEISDKLKFTDEEFALLLWCANKFPQLALYVEDQRFGFHPIYSIVYYKSPLFAGWNGEKEYDYLIKWQEARNFSNMPPIYMENKSEKFLEKLYSKKNQAKLKMFGLYTKNIDSYWY